METTKYIHVMKDIAIFGAGGFGREVACLIQQINNYIDSPEQQWNLVGYFADGATIGEKNEYGSLLGGRKELNEWDKPLGLVIAIGNPKAVKSIAESIINPNVYFPNLVAPDVTFYDDENVRIGKGNIICSHCLISCNVTIGNFNIYGCDRHDVLAGFGLETLGVDMLLNRGGKPCGVKVDEQMRTNIPNVYAAGDVTGFSMLAHTASREGEVAINNILGKKDRMRYNAGGRQRH